MKINNKLFLVIALCNILIIQFLCFFGDLNIVYAQNSIDSSKIVYGLPEDKTCLKLSEDIKATTGANLLSVYQALYSVQCEGKSATEPYYSAPTNLSKSVESIGKTCRALQVDIIYYVVSEKTPLSSDVDLYSKECLSSESQSQSASGNEGNFMPIKLGAPLPIGQDGEQIENSNKSYLFTYMVKLYRFVLGIAGIAAIIEIIIAGFQIALAADDSGGVENGKKRLIQTLEGVGILFCSAIILNTINPVAYNFDEEVVIMNMSPYIVAMENGQPQNTFYAVSPNGVVNYGGKDVAETTLPPQIKALLDVIAQEEGTPHFGKQNGYDVMFTGKTFSDYSSHPRQKICSGSLCSDAAGRYGFLWSTWKSYAERLGIRDFSPQSQDLGAAELLKDAKVYNLIVAEDINGALNVPCVYNGGTYSKLGCIWASFPRSPYGQQKRNNAELTNEIVTLFHNRLAYYKGGGSSNNNPSSQSTSNNSGTSLLDWCKKKNSQGVATVKYPGDLDYIVGTGTDIHCVDNSKNSTLLIGDSIAAGLSGFVDFDVELALPSLSLRGARESFLPALNGRKFNKIVISIGSNNPKGDTALNDLKSFRDALMNSNSEVIWIIPGSNSGAGYNIGKSAIENAANSFKDKSIPINSAQTSDKVHPNTNEYKRIAGQIK